MNWNEEEKIVTNHNIKSSTFVASFLGRCLSSLSWWQQQQQLPIFQLVPLSVPWTAATQAPMHIWRASRLLQPHSDLFTLSFASTGAQMRSTRRNRLNYLGKFFTEFEKHPFSVVCVCETQHRELTRRGWEWDPWELIFRTWPWQRRRRRRTPVKLEFLQPFSTVECEILSKQ